ncbi:MAG: tripartite tricarboxylate transporter permease [Amphritea sp.]
MFENLLSGFGHALSLYALGFALLGTFAGVFVGAIPGLSGAMLIALLLPVTFYMDPLNALSFIVGIYVGAVSGGLISATLLRIPGTISSLVTTFDGYPMAAKGKPGRALGLGIYASLFGGVVSWFFLISIAEPLSIWATKFTPFNFFALIMVAFMLISSLSEGNLLKGLISAALGFLLALPGIDPSSAQARLTFGFVDLNAGLPMLPFFVGMFAFGTVLSDIFSSHKGEGSKEVAASTEGIWISLADQKKHFGNNMRSSLTGVGIGILPGIGSNIASIASYILAKAMSKEPKKFGTGSEEGIVASEASNNAAVGGALIPTLAIGVPGSFIDVLLLAAFLIHNLQPGPLLFASHPDIVYGVIVGYLVANIMMFLIMISTVKYTAKIAHVPRAYLFPIVIVFSTIGAFALDNSVWSLWVMLIFGFAGFFLEQLKYPLAPFAVAFVLGPLAEQKLRTGLQMTAGSFDPLYTDPVNVFLLGLVALLTLMPLIKKVASKTFNSKTESC